MIPTIIATVMYYGALLWLSTIDWRIALCVLLMDTAANIAERL
jgi:hypothetical protein